MASFPVRNQQTGIFDSITPSHMIRSSNTLSTRVRQACDIKVTVSISFLINIYVIHVNNMLK